MILRNGKHLGKTDKIDVNLNNPQKIFLVVEITYLYLLKKYY